MPEHSHHQHVHRHPDRRHRTYTCSWCGATSSGEALACPGCGAAVDVTRITTASGWHELLPAKDSFKLDVHGASCQLFGKYAPIADIRLARGSGIYFVHHVLLWKDVEVSLSARQMSDQWAQFFAGMPLVMLEASGPGHIAFSRDEPGELIALAVEPGQTIDVRQQVFMVATGNIEYDWFSPEIWYSTQQMGGSEFHFPIGMFLDRFYARNTPGLVLMHGSGNVYFRDLAPGEAILVRPTSFLFKHSTVQMQLHIEKPALSERYLWSWQPRHVWLRLTGPGRVAIQSVFERGEDNGRKIVRSSPATEQAW